MNRLFASILSLLCFTTLALSQPNNSTSRNTSIITAPTIKTRVAPKKDTTQVNDTTQTATKLVKNKMHFKTGIGLRGSFDIGFMWGFSKLDKNVQRPSGVGYEFGGQIRVEISDVLYFTPEITFSKLKTSHNDDDDIKRTYDQSYLNFTLLMRAFITENVYATAGPQVSFNIGNDFTVGEITYNTPGMPDHKGHTYRENIKQSAAEFGLNLGAGYMFFNRLSVDFRWHLGITELFPEVKCYDDDDFDIRTEKKWSLINLSGARTMKFKFGVNFWII